MLEQAAQIFGLPCSSNAGQAKGSPQQIQIRETTRPQSAAAVLGAQLIFIRSYSQLLTSLPLAGFQFPVRIQQNEVRAPRLV